MLEKRNARVQKIERARFGILIWSTNIVSFSVLPIWWIMNSHDISSLPSLVWTIPPIINLISIIMVISNCGDIHFNKQVLINEREHNRFMESNSDFNKKMDIIEAELDECRKLKQQLKVQDACKQNK